MFYEPKEGHGLSKNPFNSLVVPRPIGWISSLDSDGNVNLAPYSFFNGVSYRPPTVMFASGQGEVEDDRLSPTVCMSVRRSSALPRNSTSGSGVGL